MGYFVRCAATAVTFFLVGVGWMPATERHATAQESLAIPESDAGLPGEGPIRRYDWFQRLWLEKRTGWAGRVEQDQQAVVFLGDSITQGWGDDLGGTFGDMKVANRGISGDTTRGMLLRMPQDVLPLNPRAVVLLAGTNDLEEQAEPATIVANIKLIVDQLRQHNESVPIVICKVFPASVKVQRPAGKIRELNRMIQVELGEVSHVTVLDTWTIFANSNGDAKPEEFPDLLHPNEVGYKMWGAALRPILETLGLLEAASAGRGD
jgi:lysophospholipase L1-like esterase